MWGLKLDYQVLGQFIMNPRGPHTYCLEWLDGLLSAETTTTQQGSTLLAQLVGATFVSYST